MSPRSHITTHVLDAVTGRPAVAVGVRLEQQVSDNWHDLASAQTDSDGRIGDLGPEAVSAGRYRITFDTGSYFAARDQATFYPQVTIVFELGDESAHYHVPLLLSPFAYSTYRGS
ncbi:hydroxyisourate hydrolase [Cryobacterium arcticum]|jgi:5-hydroxyisourate hydrolase|uniref:5-hydroxyisourate hydrolase n=1 Tax=Cryobacterium arcticum TaxID=670052 RepID=A0A1B1BII2_9MICO|nr:hydroxyisourate hydrolase [Cryobacterium arcticum]ANP72419.1 5-hydroxyisourate hydrolase [Cryobacterium arcticum]